MRPDFWQPPIERSAAEQAILGRVRRAKLFVFLRDQRHRLFSAAFQAELAACYPDQPKGRPPTLLQAYTGVSDDEVIEATTMDRRGPVVLDCLDCQEPP